MLLNKEVTQVMSGIKYFHVLLFNGNHKDRQLITFCNENFFQLFIYQVNVCTVLMF